MDRGARRHRYSHSRSRSSSKSRSRSRDRHKKSSRNNYEKHFKKRYRTQHRSKSPKHKNKSHHHKPHSSKKSIIKSEDNKANFKHNKKSVKFDETTTKDKDNNNENNEKKKEDFNASGALKRDLETTKNGVVLKYNEPPESTLCTHRRWRLYVYKNDEQINLFYLHRKSFYLIGRDHRVTDILCRHISISSQHAVIQYRRVKSGDNGCIVKPYIMDLKSRHGTYLMGDKIEPHRFYELLPKDKIQFGRSTREYIVLADDSNEKDVTDKSEIHISDEDKDIKQEEEKYNIWSDDD